MLVTVVVAVIAPPLPQTRNAGRFGNVNAPVILILPDKVASPLNVPDNAPALIVGDVSVLFVRVLVDDTVGTTTPSTARTPADERDNVVSVACPNSILPRPSAVDVEAVSQAIGSQVQEVKVQADGVQILGVVNTGLVVVAKTVQVQDRVYSAATQVLAANQAIVEAVPVCQEEVQPSEPKFAWEVTTEVENLVVNTLCVDTGASTFCFIIYLHKSIQSCAM